MNQRNPGSPVVVYGMGVSCIFFSNLPFGGFVTNLSVKNLIWEATLDLPFGVVSQI